ncbi:AN1-type zinc finger protein [Halogranum rubrum]|uniref:AN1-type Zinc finger protein n=1 Tax=Halogranum salarium B-1 TaxID=1210908 RepID=J2ZFW7_9EURY|nr:AN1-type zinc finger protein [Halogranum salarium]EJN59590.1 AN1-type Zinc finger protein [Halogranum salarium B-1]
MNQCSVCGTLDGLPFTCNECGQKLCGQHRLPEAHSCPGLASNDVRFGQRERRESESTGGGKLTRKLRRLVSAPIRAVGSLFR